MPGHLLSARTLVIALSPLLDERGIGALLDLRARGYDLVVIEISPLAVGEADSHGLPLRLWQLQREALRGTFRAGRRAGRAVGAPAHRPRPGDRGGDRVPAARTSRPAGVAAAAGSVAVAASLGAAAALEAESRAPALACACAGDRVPGSRYLHAAIRGDPDRAAAGRRTDVISHDGPSIGTVIYGSCLLLTAELAYWSIDEHGHRPVEPGVFAPRLVAILAVVAAGDPREHAGARGRRRRHHALAGVDGSRSDGDRGVHRAPRGDGASARGVMRSPSPG